MVWSFTLALRALALAVVLGAVGCGDATAGVIPAGHETTLAGASARAGFHVLSLKGVPGARLVQVLDPPGAPGGTASLVYVLDGTVLQLTEARDPDPSSPPDVKLKAGATCGGLENLQGVTFFINRCPSGQWISQAFWKAAGLTFWLEPEPPAGSGKGSPPPQLSVQLIETVATHLS